MIRRNAATPTPGSWVLISQVDHAHLAADLAEHWGAGGVAPLVARDELLWAICHHDDGWRRWEQSPDVDPSSCRPRAFTEMELADGLEIWTRSIEAAARHSPLAGYVVAGHFCALLRRYGTWKSDQKQTELAEQFLATSDRLMEVALCDWTATSPQSNTQQRAELALAQLQLFDVLSLWFCCEEATAGDELDTPEGPVLTITPGKPAADGEPIPVSLAPWPLLVERLNLEIRGRRIPIGRYKSRQELAAAPAQSVLLRWRLQPGW